MLKIVTAPHSILSQKAKLVAKIDKYILRLIEDMKQALDMAKDPVGVGLASPQIGEVLQIFIAKPTPKSPVQIFINPKIVSSIKYQALSKKNDSILNTKYKIHNTKLEGCLSLPNIWGDIERYPIITVSYLDEKDRNHKRKFKGFIATIIQHEMDHLEGILFPTRVLEQKGKLYKSHKDEKGEDVFDEIDI